MRSRLFLYSGKEKFIDRHHPWIFSGAVRRVDGSPQAGDLVDVLSSDGHWLAVGHYQPESICVKVLSYATPDIDDTWWRERVASAVDYRRSMGFFQNADTNMFRLVHAEGDFLPGLVVDYYNGAVVLQSHSAGMHRETSRVAALLADILGDKMRCAYDKSAATLADSVDGFVWGEQRDEWETREHGIRYLINICEGQKTGFFLDQRDNRGMLQSLAQGRRVLNCFGYTGGFSLSALHGGCDYVETVDISKRAIELCNRNVMLNYGSDASHRGVTDDVMRYLDTVRQDFDIIVLDPPAFAKNHRSLQQGLKGYRSINQRAIEALPSGGLLFTFSCSQAVSADDFQTMAFSAANLVGKQVRVVRRLGHGADHPVSIYHPEGEYLKGLLLEIEN